MVNIKDAAALLVRPNKPSKKCRDPADQTGIANFRPKLEKVQSQL